MTIHNCRHPLTWIPPTVDILCYICKTYFKVYFPVGMTIRILCHLPMADTSTIALPSTPSNHPPVHLHTLTKSCRLENLQRMTDCQCRIFGYFQRLQRSHHPSIHYCCYSVDPKVLHMDLGKWNKQQHYLSEGREKLTSYSP